MAQVEEDFGAEVPIAFLVPPYARPMPCPVLAYARPMPCTVLTYRMIARIDIAPITLRVSYAMPGTSSAYGAATAYTIPTLCPVLRQRTVVPGA
eukprot:423566-Rhodomonas_salina.2